MKSTAHYILCGSFLLLLLLSACEKSRENTASGNPPPNSADQFVKYTIRNGQQYCDQNTFRTTNYSELKFLVKFDSTAIYQTVSPANQLDINKLYGFSDNSSEHHQFSARFGWRWNDGALRLFAYVYNSGIMSFEELGTIIIGTAQSCSIKVNPSSYAFTLNGTTRTIPRNSTAATAVGYQLYPYFGGNETAPHDIHIWIKQLN